MPRAQQPEPNEANRETTPPPPEPQRIGGAPHETINNLVFVLNLVNWNDSSLGQQLGWGLMFSHDSRKPKFVVISSRIENCVQKNLT